MSAPPEGTRGWLVALAIFGGLGGALLGALFDVMIIGLGVEANRYGFVAGPWIALAGAIGLPALKVMSDRSRTRSAQQSAPRDHEAGLVAVDPTKPDLPTASSDPTDRNDAFRSD